MKASGLFLRAGALTLGACLVTWLLLGPLDFAARPYTAALRWAADSVAQASGGEFVTRVLFSRGGTEGPASTDRKDKLRIALRRSGGRALGVKPFNARRLGYVPNAIFLALALVTILPWRRRLFTLAAGLALMQGFVGLRLLAQVLYAWISVDEQHGLELSSFLEHPWTKEVLTLWLRAEKETFPHVIVPIVVWAALSFRAADWERWFGRPRDSRGGAQR